MKIKIIADPLNEKLTGVGNYTRNIIKSAKENNLIVEEINYKKTGKNTVIYKNFFENKKFEKLLWYLSLPFRIKKEKNSIIHNTSGIPNFFHFKNKYIFTIHDLTILIYPKTHTLGSKLLLKLFLPRTLKYADEIVAMSENTKKDLIKFFPKIDKNKIKVVYPYASEDFKLISDKELLTKCKNKYNLPEKFFLYVGTLEPRKNIINLLKAISQNYSKLKIPLVIVGKKGWKYKSFFETYKRLNLEDIVIFTGFVDQEDLPEIYNLALCLIYPSYYEGFGLPPLEAMKCGIPVITSNVSSLPEVVGDAEIMIDPDDVNQLDHEMYKVATNETLRKKMIQQGFERAKKFNRSSFSKGIMNIYKELIPKQ